MLIGFVKRVATTYTITDRRLNIKRGIISREVQETRLERVQNVNYKQSVYQRVMQIGDVDFDTAAGDDYNFVFAGVADPARRRPQRRPSHGGRGGRRSRTRRGTATELGPDRAGGPGLCSRSSAWMTCPGQAFVFSGQRRIDAAVDRRFVCFVAVEIDFG